MFPRRYVGAALAAMHIVVVVCGASSRLPDWTSGPAGKSLRWYATMSGADSTYGFFAPEVGALHRARFLLRDKNGSTWWDSFDRAGNNEARLRLSGIVEAAFTSGDAQALPQWRKRLVKSWAATLFSRHRRAVSLTVVVEFYDVPRMADYRAGTRPQWREAYRARIRRNTPPIQTGRNQ